MLTTLLFDLDGTLLPLDLDVFLRGYFKSVLPRLGEFGDVAKLHQALMGATEAVIANEDATETNMEVFQQSFQQLTGIDISQIWPVFDDFYENHFDSLQQLTQPTIIAREICRNAVNKGYRLAMATNPIFPETAIRRRMQWAHVGDVQFSLVTTMEGMHFCKPNPKYFIEIMDKLDVSPNECMMFGNDVQEDGVASKVGIDTFLVTDCLIDRGLGDFEFSHRGTLEDVLRFVNDLPALP